MQVGLEQSSKTPKKRVLLVDDHSLVAETISLALSANNESMTLETASSTEEAVDLINQGGRFDVILLDYDLPGERGLNGLQKLIAVNDGGVALFSGVAGHGVMERALEMGAAGFVPKTLPLKTLKHAINFIADGEVFVPAAITASYFSPPTNELGLKPREVMVLGYLAEGLANKEIGLKLDLAESIVKFDVKSICRKLDVKNRTQAVIEARRLRLV
ncbi:response regulator transcription factor [Roseibaca sp. V10]|uniref:Response regulator transcription factor n=1 Tax=Roseinatronobacter domitianus TaxID=2940293 RepID=A0ABT0LWZ6_9RHOB|nr:response regulator transcription factor [Roseibaca domitiana]MCL1627126.1 response regulator transcription factor [Roseibaca domitiana]